MRDKQFGLNDIEPFERLCDINFKLASSMLGNKFRRVEANVDVTNFFIFLAESGDIQYYQVIASIAVFFDPSSFAKRV